ncbi:hypothetical protein [Cognataquiflexum aquatile]|nr:hypothetical protein [Cognataquiflexum aquatile]
MKLSKPQIEQLKTLISKKGYSEIDVKYEILDHVAWTFVNHFSIIQSPQP